MGGFLGFDFALQAPATDRLATVLATLSDLGHDLDVATTTAELSGHDGRARTLLSELSEELDLTRRIIVTRADLAMAYRLREPEWADLLRQRQAALFDDLEASLGDGRGLAGTSADVRAYYLAKAFEKAGIDPSTWDPSRGAEYNREIIEKVYTYYGKLYLDNPYMMWAGMANLIGPSFAAGFFDLSMIREWARTAAEGLDKIPDEVRHLLPPGVESLEELARATDEDLERSSRRSSCRCRRRSSSTRRSCTRRTSRAAWTRCVSCAPRGSRWTTTRRSRRGR